VHLTLVAVGKASEPFVQEGCSAYGEKIRRYTDLAVILVREEKIPAQGKREYILRAEGRRIREKLPAEGLRVALDEKGRLWNSPSFALFLKKEMESGRKHLTFIVGGPYGIEEALRKEASLCLALSPMTLTHGMARMILLEQIYRAFTLMRGEPYHK
jgi:23S rRNA (pseudouridine1915-N3)-methyltransferase